MNVDDIQDSPLSHPFFSRRLKMLLTSDGFSLYRELGVDFFTTSGLLDPNMKLTIRLIRPRPIFYMISDNPNVSLAIVDFSLYTRRTGHKEVYHKKEWTCMHMLRWNTTRWKLWQRHLSFHPVKINSSKRKFSKMLPFVESQKPGIHTILSLVLSLKPVFVSTIRSQTN